MQSSESDELPVREAVALGLIQGPAELLPISSSSHTTLIPWLLRWRCAGLDVEMRRSFEVCLHAGTAAALLAVRLRTPSPGRPPPSALLLAIGPPAAAGYLLEGFIDRRLSTPETIALGLLVGAACMAAADGTSGRFRRAPQAGLADGLLLGLAQVFALAPGISRNGATLAVARARGFSRADADALSWDVGVPVIVGAGVLKATRAARRGQSKRMPRQLAAGATAAFLSTLASARMLGRGRSSIAGAPSGLDARRSGGSGRGALIPYAAYRLALALVVVRRLCRDRGQEGSNRRAAVAPPPGAY
jgi:undecaprenyl-diphosphatase